MPAAMNMRRESGKGHELFNETFDKYDKDGNGE